MAGGTDAAGVIRRHRDGGLGVCGACGWPFPCDAVRMARGWTMAAEGQRLMAERLAELGEPGWRPPGPAGMERLLAVEATAAALVRELGNGDTDTGELPAIADALKRMTDGVNVSGTWPVVVWFARAMEAKLRENSWKGEREGWLREDPLWLLTRMEEEEHELWRVVTSGEDRGRVLGEAADVANFAMMVADRYSEDRGEGDEGGV